MHRRFAQRMRALQLVRRTIVVTCLLSGTMVAAEAGAAQPPHIVDVAGDANGIMTPIWTGGMVGYLLEQVFGNQDPLGGGTSTAPASFQPADIRAVTFETPYRALAVGADGIDYQPTGLKIVIETTAIPSGEIPLRFVLKTFLLPADGGLACRSELAGFVGDHPGPYSRSSGTLIWRPVGDFGSDCPIPERDDYTDPKWTATISSTPPGIILSFPHDSLNQAELRFLGEGSILERPKAFSAVYVDGGWTDATPLSDEFVVGQDMPQDVPCTRECPDNA